MRQIRQALRPYLEAGLSYAQVGRAVGIGIGIGIDIGKCCGSQILPMRLTDRTNDGIG